MNKYNEISDILYINIIICGSSMDWVAAGMASEDFKEEEEYFIGVSLSGSCFSSCMELSGLKS
jgi:hypothetical protein